RRMIRIDESKYIDTSMITHAEYQLFLNEMQQNQQFHHPDHWTTYQYASGEGRKPVVGIRPSDAIAFCRWLGYRESGTWQYRLLTEDEIKLGLVHREAHTEETPNAGYWYLTKAGYRCSPFTYPMPEEEIITVVTRRFEDDWHLYDPNRQAGLFEQAQNIVLTRAKKRQFTMRDLDRNLDNQLQDYPVILQDLNRIRERGLGDITLELDYALENAIAQVNNPDLSAARNIDVEHIFALAEKLHSDLEKAKDIEMPRGLTQEIFRSAEYALGLAGNRRLVMYQELDRALNNALRLTRDLRKIIRRAYSRARTRVRANAMAEMAELISLNERRKASGQPEVSEHYVQLIVALADLYLDIAILEDRTNKRLPAFEGMRLIRIRA
ncbi:MAG: SUMF1/EgtB/PvdO family nonheme iron enzyme, partial [Anaerolineales bacterium]|nr:SUMF1/EgtB/PvdO family nonheme iron enzyme [Anaerolineales bacterium]